MKSILYPKLPLLAFLLVANAPPSYGADPGYGRWVPIQYWHRCERMIKRGSVFEIQNEEGASMLSGCTKEAPARPADWKSDPVRFRVVKERPTERSSEPPPPQEQKEHKRKHY